MGVFLDVLRVLLHSKLRKCEDGQKSFDIFSHATYNPYDETHAEIILAAALCRCSSK